MIHRVDYGRQTHGVQLISYDGIVYQGIGLEAPPGYILALPKYMLVSGERCGSGIWRRGSICLTRIIDDYGPKGLEDSIKKAGIKLRYDARYGAPMPYIPLDEVLELVHPRQAVQNIIMSPRSEASHDAIAVIRSLRDYGVSADSIGLTGSLALGFEHVKFSDIDLVVYGARNAVRMWEIFTSKNVGGGRLLTVIGGLRVHPPLDTSWRRAVLPWSRRFVSWVGVPEEPLSHCMELKDIDKRPEIPIRVRVRIEPGQDSALLYPPCVETKESIRLVSFEYNVGAIFYRGGVLEVAGLGSSDYSMLYVGLREYPGNIIHGKYP